MPEAPSLSFAHRVCHPNARTHVRLLGPCFKTGRLRPFRQDPEHACAGAESPAHRTASSTEARMTPTACTKARAMTSIQAWKKGKTLTHSRGSATEPTRFPRHRTDPDSTTPTRCEHKHRQQDGDSQHWSQSLPFQQFQALFNSLFKVLFIFPSRYLFAIGLSPIFSFRWNLPPTLSCSPKQLDSSKAHRTPRTPSHRRGSHPLWSALFQVTYAGAATDDSFYRLQFAPKGRDFQLSSSRFTRRYWGNPG